MKTKLFLTAFLFSVTFMTSCTNNTKLTATAITSAQQNFAEQLVGAYSCQTVSECGDTIKAWIPNELRFSICPGKAVILNDDGVGKNPVVEKVL